MAKKNKKEIKMIDMSERLNVEIIPATDEEIIETEKELEELNLIIIKKIEEYNSYLSKMIREFLKEDTICNEKEDIQKKSLYFIEKYDTFLKNRNVSNIQKIVEEYQEIAKSKKQEQES